MQLLTGGFHLGPCRKKVGQMRRRSTDTWASNSGSPKKNNFLGATKSPLMMNAGVLKDFLPGKFNIYLKNDGWKTILAFRKVLFSGSMLNIRGVWCMTKEFTK